MSMYQGFRGLETNSRLADELRPSPQPAPRPQVAPRYEYVLVACDEEGGITRVNTAPYTPEWKAALQEQADRMRERAWVQREEIRQ